MENRTYLKKSSSSLLREEGRSGFEATMTRGIEAEKSF
jgi:hypothetical protein